MSLATLNATDLNWLLQLICGFHRRPFSSELLAQQFPPPHTTQTLADAAQTLGLGCIQVRRKPAALHREVFPLAAQLTSVDNGAEPSLCVLLQADAHQVLLIEAGQQAPVTLSLAEFSRRYLGTVFRMAPIVDTTATDGIDTTPQRRFGFHWFYAELRKHRTLWHEVLLASLVIQLIALATPLFTQTIIDKVVVHHTQSTLIVIGIGMALLMLFSAGLSWLRQYLVLHTGNRVDAALGAAVVARLFKLPPMYFQHRPTGVIAARLHGVETIREFVSSAAVTLVLDLPFLLVFVAIMFYYSVTLTLIVLAVLAVIVSLSALVAPMFQSRLQQQFMLGARNQAFLTEYIGGLETVKSLQLEPQLNARYSAYLSAYLQANFATRQLGNTYNIVANLLEQLMGLIVLVVGAWTVMHSAEFTIGMLVAFQMFSGRLSQPMLRLVGLWQQFQQARLAIDRLGDLMNVPEEPYSTLPARDAQRAGRVQIDAIAFKYAEHLPFVYRGLVLAIEPGSAVALMGPSGSGKSTLAKLLQGFYQPHEGRILLDGVDIRYMSANELRGCFGVVPQETVLFSGTIYDNLQMASPTANFEQIAAACRMAEIHDTIEAMPQGYQSLIGERGAGLSGGQKQRIAIARALLKRPAILIFDEATSALDSATAEQFARTVNSLKGRVTMLFITHSLPRGLQFDAVYRLGPDGAQSLVQSLRAAPPAPVATHSV